MLLFGTLTHFGNSTGFSVHLPPLRPLMADYASLKALYLMQWRRQVWVR